MQDDKLKELIQAVLDGKQLQYYNHHKQCLGTPSIVWNDVNLPKSKVDSLNRVLSSMNICTFRIKPQVKTFKYKTRPYSYIGGRSEKYSVWVSSEHHFSQEYIESWGDNKGFKWLAPTTEHEVEYE